MVSMVALVEVLLVGWTQVLMEMQMECLSASLLGSLLVRLLTDNSNCCCNHFPPQSNSVDSTVY